MQAGPASREGRAGCEPGMSVLADRNEQLSAGRCPRRRSRNGGGGQDGLRWSCRPCTRPGCLLPVRGKRPQALPGAPRPVRSRDRDRDRDKNRGRSRGTAGWGQAAGAGPAARPRQPMAVGAERYITAGGCHWLRSALATPRGGHTLGPGQGSGSAGTGPSHSRKPKSAASPGKRCWSKAGRGEQRVQRSPVEGDQRDPAAARSISAGVSMCPDMDGKPPGGSRMRRHRAPSWLLHTAGPDVHESRYSLYRSSPWIQGQDTREQLQASSGEAQAG